MSSQIPKDFLEMSYNLGSNFSLVQGAGGNTSIKVGSKMYIKASGTNLSDAYEREIFTTVDLALSPFSEKFPIIDGLKPSIETSMHMVLNHRIVAHVHSVSVIALSCLSNAKDIFSEILSEWNWLYVPYLKPGLGLSKYIANSLGKSGDDHSNVIILANHGLVVGGDTVAEVTRTIDRVVKLAESAVSGSKAPDADIDVDRIREKCPIGYVSITNQEVHALAYNQKVMRLVSKGSLYPDHVVFLGRAVRVLEGVSDTPLNKTESKLTLLPNVGAYLPAESPSIDHDMAAALAKIAFHIPVDREVNYLSRFDEDQLLNWDAEKYRQKLNG